MGFFVQMNAIETAKRALDNPASNIMRGTERKLLQEQLTACGVTLQWVQNNEADIRAYVAARRESEDA